MCVCQMASAPRPLQAQLGAKEGRSRGCVSPLALLRVALLCITLRRIESQEGGQLHSGCIMPWSAALQAAWQVPPSGGAQPYNTSSQLPEFRAAAQATPACCVLANETSTRAAMCDKLPTLPCTPAAAHLGAHLLPKACWCHRVGRLHRSRLHLPRLCMHMRKAQQGRDSTFTWLKRISQRRGERQ